MDIDRRHGGLPGCFAKDNRDDDSTRFVSPSHDNRPTFWVSGRGEPEGWVLGSVSFWCKDGMGGDGNDLPPCFLSNKRSEARTMCTAALALFDTELCLSRVYTWRRQFLFNG